MLSLSLYQSQFVVADPFFAACVNHLNQKYVYSLFVLLQGIFMTQLNILFCQPVSKYTKIPSKLKMILCSSFILLLF